MELLSSLHEIKVANCIKEAIELHNITSKHDKNLSLVKTNLRDNCNLVFFSIISVQDNIIKIMAKTLRHSYFYQYSLRTKEINLVGGVRKNVATN